MAFDPTYFASAGGQSKHAAAPATFTYKTADSKATILTAAYIPASYAGLFSIGDYIDVVIVDSVTAPTQVQETATLLVTNVVAASISGVAASVSLADISQTNFGSANYIRMPFEFNQTDLLAPTSQWTISPVAGTLRRLVVIVGSVAVTTGGDIGVKLGGTAVTGLTCTVADAASTGTVVQDTPTSVTRLTADQAIEVTAGAPFATAGTVYGFVEIVPDVYTGDLYVPYFANATDLSAGTSQFWPAPENGQIIKAGAVVQVAIVTGGDLTFKIATVAVVGLTVTIADSATVGTVVTDTPTSLTGATGAITNAQAIETAIAAAFNGGGAVNGYVTIRPTIPTRKAYVWFTGNQTDVLAPTDHFAAAPMNGNITRAATAVQVAVGTGGNVTFKRGSATVLGLTVVVANSATAGTVNQDNSTSPTDVTDLVLDGQSMEVVYDAAFATSGALNGFIEITPLAA